MPEQQRPVDTQRLLLAEPRPAVVGDRHQAARVLAPPPGLQQSIAEFRARNKGPSEGS